MLVICDDIEIQSSEHSELENIFLNQSQKDFSEDIWEFVCERNVEGGGCTLP